MRAVWATRLTGLVLFLLAIAAFTHAESLEKWLGGTEWMRIDRDDVVRYGSIASAAVSLRLLVFGLRIWARTGIIFLIFVGLDVLVECAPRPASGTAPYFDAPDIAVGLVLLLYVYPAAVASLLMAAIPMFDARVQSRRAIALH
jgi:hypothetical protein